MLPAGVSGVVPIAHTVGDDSHDNALLQAAYLQAKSFLMSHKWWIGLREIYFGVGLTAH
jgi:hypothetical protein